MPRSKGTSATRGGRRLSCASTPILARKDDEGRLGGIADHGILVGHGGVAAQAQPVGQEGEVGVMSPAAPRVMLPVLA